MVLITVPDPDLEIRRKGGWGRRQGAVIHILT